MGLFKKVLFIVSFFSFLFLFSIPTQAVETKKSLKKGAGLVWQQIPANYCNGVSDPSTCRNRFGSTMESLGITWFYNWTVDNNAFNLFPNIIFVPMIWGQGEGVNAQYTTSALNVYSNLAVLHPGSYWLIWNEPDLSWVTGIPDFYPDGSNDWKDTAVRAAQIYKPLSQAIINADSSAKLIIGGISTPTGSRWRYWTEIFMESYRNIHPGENPDFSGWHVHSYTCPGGYDLNTWRQTITGFRDYINNNGGGSSKQIWLTEFGCLNEDYPQIITDQLDWMENYTGIQRYAWFSAGQYQWMHANLFNGLLPDSPSFGLSNVGLTYAQYPQNPNPVPSSTSAPQPIPTPTRIPTNTPAPTTPPACFCQEQGGTRCPSSCSSYGTINFSCVIPPTAGAFNHCNRIDRIRGDADGVGGVTLGDFDYYRRIVLFDTGIPGFVNADFNGDGQISTIDGGIVLHTLGLL